MAIVCPMCDQEVSASDVTKLSHKDIHVDQFNTEEEEGNSAVNQSKNDKKRLVKEDDAPQSVDP